MHRRYATARSLFPTTCSAYSRTSSRNSSSALSSSTEHQDGDEAFRDRRPSAPVSGLCEHFQQEALDPAFRPSSRGQSRHRAAAPLRDQCTNLGPEQEQSEIDGKQGKLVYSSQARADEEQRLSDQLIGFLQATINSGETTHAWLRRFNDELIAQWRTIARNAVQKWEVCAEMILNTDPAPIWIFRSPILPAV